jgi:hypothetical protein
MIEMVRMKAFLGSDPNLPFTELAREIHLLFTSGNRDWELELYRTGRWGIRQSRARIPCNDSRGSQPKSDAAAQRANRSQDQQYQRSRLGQF